MLQNLKVQKTLLWAVKILVFVFVLYFLVQQLYKIKLNDFSSLALERPLYLVFVIFLLPINWFLEFLKWTFTVKKISSKYSFRLILNSMLAGISTGIVTPNRIGNFIGRMLHFKGKTKGQVIIGTLYNNLAQFLASILYGLIGIYFFSKYFLEGGYSIEAIGIALTFILLALFLYVAYPYLKISKLSKMKRYLNSLLLFQRVAKKIMFPILFLSLLRYLVFVLQFILILIAFGATYTHDLIFGIFAMYFITTLTPNLIMGKLVIRESVALFVLSYFVENPAIIILSSILLWVINLGIPSLIGVYFLFTNKRNKNA